MCTRMRVCVQNIQQALMTLQNLQQQHMVATDLEAVPDLVHTLRKVKLFIYLLGW